VIFFSVYIPNELEIKDAIYNLHACYIYIYIINVIENTEGAIKMDNQEKVATRRRKTNKNYYTICVGDHYPQTNTHNVNKT
jgi:hypothetical protein